MIPFPLAPIASVADVTLGKMLQPRRKADNDREAPYLHAANIKRYGNTDLTYKVKQMWFTPDELSSLTIAPDDVAVVEGGAVGQSAVFPHGLPGWSFQNSIVRIRPKTQQSVGRFINYALQSAVEAGEIDRQTNSATISHFTAERVARFRIPCPSIDTQRAIADYLDRETSEINAVLDKLEGLNQLFEERRLVTVRNTVHGENPDLRSSEEWRSSKLSHVVTFKNGRDFKSTESRTDNIPVYGSGGVFAHTKEWLYDGESVLFGRKGTVDRPLYVTGKFWTVDTMYYTIPGPHVLAKYIYYWATTAPYSVISTQTAVPSTTSGDLGRLMLPLPPLNEQAHIVTHLNKAIAQIDAMLAKVQELKDLLIERRSALITAAVTGQIEVN